TPPARFGAAVAYDPIRRVLVVFGGQPAPGTPDIADTWEWDGRVWTALAPRNAPGPRTGARMVFDPHRHRLLLFGGRGSGVFQNDTWEWDGTNWDELDTALAPPPRADAALAYDPLHDQIVLFGGTYFVGTHGDTWTLQGTTWTEALPTTSPPARSDA